MKAFSFNRDSKVFETTAGASFPHFAWFHPRDGLNSVHKDEMNSQSAVPAPPIRTVPPEPGSTESIKTRDKTAKARKQKHSAKDSGQTGSNVLKPKKPSNKKKKPTVPKANHERKNLDIDTSGANLDLSQVPIPYCSCTGVARACYKWGAGGWQSSCCTINISEHPLPMSTSRPGARMAGRKMSNGAYTKLLIRLAAEGHDLHRPVDLRSHWAKHGTNKFVTIK